jgi:hypothetical protein
MVISKGEGISITAAKVANTTTVTLSSGMDDC